MTIEGPEPAPIVPSAARSHADRIALAWLPAILYTGLIWWLSSQAVPIQGLDRFPFQDKGLHFVEYGSLALTICFAVFRTWPGRGARAVWASVLITAGLGFLDELHQAFVPGRSSDALDLLTDLFGALVFAFAYYAILRLWRSPLTTPR